MTSITAPQTVEQWPIERLRRHEQNARTHTAAQVAQVAASMQEWGFTNPILAGADGVVIAGHCRLAAAKKLGLQQVPVIVLDYMTPEQRRAYVIADNQLALQSGWDLGVLEAEIEALQVEGFDVDLLGFDADELSQLLAGGDEGTDDGEDDDEDDVIDRSMALAIVLTPEEMAQWREAKAELGYSKDKTAFWQLVTTYLGEVRANG
jgi:ParB-like chromosome segregation protein Spo0J